MAQLNSTVIKGGLAVSEDIIAGGSTTVENINGKSASFQKTLGATVASVAINRSDGDDYFYLRCKADGIGKFSVNTNGSFWSASNGTIANILTINGTDDATAATNGALRVSGGVGIAKSLYVGESLNVTAGKQINCNKIFSNYNNLVNFGNKASINTNTGEFSGFSYTATSDARLKENIIKYEPEKSILDLPIYKYDFINGTKNQIGCLAQDLQEICPEIVNENEDGYLGIQESKLVYLLLDEVKKLKAEVEELKTKQ